MRRWFFVVIALTTALFLQHAFFPSPFGVESQVKANPPEVTNSQEMSIDNPDSIRIIDKPIKMTTHKLELAREYAKIHYSMDTTTIVPRIIVIHYTASDSLDSVYSYFYPEESDNSFYQDQGEMNVCSQFLVDRDGTIYRLTSETFLARHIIGLNWCSIGIENIGGVNGKEDLTLAQLMANEKLIRYLAIKYITIKYLIGHYQQDYMKQEGLWRENVPGYYSYKIDPGPTFMQNIINQVLDLKLSTFPI